MEQLYRERRDTLDFDAMVEELANRVIAAMAEIEAEQKPAEACSTTGFCYADTPVSDRLKSAFWTLRLYRVFSLSYRFLSEFSCSSA